MLLELACFNLESCLIAQDAGANRIELCDNYMVGGITASHKLIQEARVQLSIDLFVMIRPRTGNYNYSDEEFIQMQESILFCKKNNCNGIVFGILNELGEVDNERCKKLIELAHPLPCTFHRAFDECKKSEQCLEDIIACGFTRVLTSGGCKTALEGAAQIKKLIQQTKNRISIMPGGGIRAENILEIKQITGATEFHSSAIKNKSEFADENEIKTMLNLLH